MKEGHISTHFDRELEELKDNLIYEGALVERAISDDHMSMSFFV